MRRELADFYLICLFYECFIVIWPIRLASFSSAPKSFMLCLGLRIVMKGKWYYKYIIRFLCRTVHFYFFRKRKSVHS